jgi:hypothetical protein
MNDEEMGLRVAQAIKSTLNLSANHDEWIMGVLIFASTSVELMALSVGSQATIAYLESAIESLHSRGDSPGTRAMH